MSLLLQAMHLLQVSISGGFLVLFFSLCFVGFFVVFLNEDIHGGKILRSKEGKKKLNCSSVYCQNNELSRG